MTLEQIRGLVTADFEAVDRVVKQRLHSQVALVDQVATYIIYAGGKRLRPLLVLLAARACGLHGHYPNQSSHTASAPPSPIAAQTNS